MMELNKGLKSLGGEYLTLPQQRFILYHNYYSKPKQATRNMSEADFKKMITEITASLSNEEMGSTEV